VGVYTELTNYGCSTIPLRDKRSPCSQINRVTEIRLDQARCLVEGSLTHTFVHVHNCMEKEGSSVLLKGGMIQG